jgi:hypothetical protein
MQWRFVHNHYHHKRIRTLLLQVGYCAFHNLAGTDYVIHHYNIFAL